MSRPSGTFDASRYFRGADDLGFYNVGTSVVRQMAREIAREHRDHWSIDEAFAFANALMPDRHLEVKGLAVETVARFRRDLAPRHLPTLKAWLARNFSANWATTDAICGLLLGPLVLAHQGLVPGVGAWSRHRNLWVRRASAVGLIPSARRGLALATAYDVAKRLHADGEDLIQKAVGWMLREAGKTDADRLEKYLRQNGPRIPRTTVRYAIERYPPARRRELLAATKGG